MVLSKRNPADTEEKLRECSLYRPDLDIAIVHESEKVAGYALFWMDPVTKVGLVEPMRIEEEFRRRGLGSALLSEGIRLLRAAGAELLKVGYFESNEAARKLYHKLGFKDRFKVITYKRYQSEPDGVEIADKPRP